MPVRRDAAVSGGRRAPGVAYEVRPGMLEAGSVAERVELAAAGLRASIAHLDGSAPM